MISFHNMLPEDGVDHDDIHIKYQYTLPNGSFVWAGMSATMETNAIWNKIIHRKRGEDPILGVFFEHKKYYERLGDMPTAIYVWHRDRAAAQRYPIPHTYQVCFKPTRHKVCSRSTGS